MPGPGTAFPKSCVAGLGVSVLVTGLGWLDPGGRAGHHQNGRSPGGHNGHSAPGCLEGGHSRATTFNSHEQLSHVLFGGIFSQLTYSNPMKFSKQEVFRGSLPMPASKS